MSRPPRTPITPMQNRVILALVLLAAVIGSLMIVVGSRPTVGDVAGRATVGSGDATPFAAPPATSTTLAPGASGQAGGGEDHDPSGGSTNPGPAEPAEPAPEPEPEPEPEPSGLLRLPQQPIQLDTGIDSGMFRIRNDGDGPLRIFAIDHPGYLAVAPDDPVPDTVPPRTTIQIQFGSMAPDYNGGNPGPWQRAVHFDTDGGAGDVIIQGEAPVPGDLVVPVAVPPKAYPLGQAFWIHQSGPAATTVKVSVGPGLTLVDDPTFTMGVGAATVVGVKPCGRPFAAVDKTFMRKVYFEVLGHGAYETQVNWSIEAGPAEPCPGQAI